MKKCLLVIFSAVILLSGCSSPPASKEDCLYCSNKPVYIYEINGQELSLCEACYEAELKALEQEKINSQK